MAETKKTAVPSAAALKKRRKKKRKAFIKKYRALIIAGSAIVVLLAVLLILIPILQKNAAAQASSESSSVSIAPSTAANLVLTDADNIAEVQVTCRDDSSKDFLLKRIGSSSFDIPLLKGYELNQDDINSLGSTFSHVYASMEVENSESLADYGLEKPSYTFAYTFRDDTEPITIEVGDAVPGTSSYYGRVSGGDKVYVLSGIASFMVDPLAYVSTQVTDRPSTLINPSSDRWIADLLFDSIDITGTGLNNPLHSEQEDMSKYSKVTATAYRYYVTDGTRRSLLNTSIEEVFQGTSVFGLTADSVVAIGVDEQGLAKYGLDKPYKQLDIAVNGSTYTLKCSPIPDEAGYYYVARNGLKAVFRVSGETLVWAEYDYLDVASSLIFTPYIDDVEKIILDFGDGVKHELTSNCPDVSTDLQVFYNGDTEVDAKGYRTFFSLIIYSVADQFLTGDEDLSVDPVLTITYVQQNGTQDVVRFIPVSARSVAIDYNGNAQFYMRAEFIDKIARELQHLVDGENVSATW